LASGFWQNLERFTKDLIFIPKKVFFPRGRNKTGKRRHNIASARLWGAGPFKRRKRKDETR
jgi:hypothetical protein